MRGACVNIHSHGKCEADFQDLGTFLIYYMYYEELMTEWCV
jgi:hypothetical protein